MGHDNRRFRFLRFRQKTWQNLTRQKTIFFFWKYIYTHVGPPARCKSDHNYTYFPNGSLFFRKLYLLDFEIIKPFFCQIFSKNLLRKKSHFHSKLNYYYLLQTHTHAHVSFYYSKSLKETSLKLLTTKEKIK